MEAFHVICCSAGSETESDLVFTRQPRMTLLSEGLAPAKNFDMASRTSRGKDPSSLVPRGGASDHV